MLYAYRCHIIFDHANLNFGLTVLKLNKIKIKLRIKKIVKIVSIEILIKVTNLQLLVLGIQKHFLATIDANKIEFITI